MSKTDDQLAAITAAVQRTAADVTAILDRLKTTGLSPEQSAILDQATAALGTVDDAMEAAQAGGAAASGAAHKGASHR